MLKLIIVSFIMAVFSLSQFAFSEEWRKAGKRMNVEYYEVVLVKYKAGKAGDANDYINKYFIPATEAAGTPRPYVIHMQTGPWDAVYFWEQKGGMGDFDWYITANDEKWWAALAKLNGGMEKAEKIWDDYIVMVSHSRREIGHHHIPPKEEAKE